MWFGKKSKKSESNGESRKNREKKHLPLTAQDPLGRKIARPDRFNGNGRLTFTIESSLSPITDQMTDGVLTVARDGLILSCNAPACRIANQSSENLVGSRLFDLIHPTSLEALAEIWGQEDLPMRRADVFLRTHTATGLPVSLVVQSLSAHAEGYSVLIIDLSARQEQLRVNNSLALFRSCFEGANDPILLLDANLTVNFANGKAVKTYGYPFERLIGMNIRDLTAICMRDTIESQFKLAVRSAGAVFETEHLDNADALLPVEVSIRPIAQDHRQYFVVIVRNVVQRREREMVLLNRITELEHHLSERSRSYDQLISEYQTISQEKQDLRAELEEQMALLSSLFDHLPFPAARVDIDGRTIEVNSAFERVFQFKVEEIQGSILTEVIAPSELHNEADLVAFAASHQSITLHRTRRVRKDGSEVLVDIHGTPVTTAGKRVGAFLVIVDQTEIGAREAQHRLFGEILGMSEELGAFAYFEWDIPKDQVRCSPNTDRLINRQLSQHPCSFQEFLDCVHPLDRPIVKASSNDWLDSAQPFEIEFRLDESTSRELWILMRGKMILDDTGQACRMIALLEDSSQLKAFKREYSLIQKDLETRVRKRTAELGREIKQLRNDIAKYQDLVGRVRQEEQQSCALLDNAVDGMILVDGDGRVMRSNQSIASILGYSNEDMIGIGELELIHPEDLGRAENVFTAVRSQPGSSSAIELRYRHQDASYKWTEVIVKNLFHDPAVRASVAYLRDITERHLMEEALQESKKRLEGILSSTTDLVWSCSLEDYELLFITPTIESTYGMTVDDALRSRTLWISMVHPEDQSIVKAKLNTIRDNREFELEYRILRSDGRIRLVKSRAWLVLDPGGQPTRIDGITTDVTELRFLKDSLNTSGDLIRSLLENIAGSYFCIDRHGIILDMNQRAETEFFGRSRDILIGQNLWEEYPELGDSVFFREFDRASRDQVVVHFESPALITDGWVEVHTQPSSDVLRTYLRDISKWKRMESDLRRKQGELSNIIESALDAIIMIDGRGRITLFNSAAERMFSARSIETIGAPIANLIPGITVASQGENESSTSGTTARREIPLGSIRTLMGFRGGKQEFPIEASMSQIEIGGDNFYAMIVRDITDRVLSVRRFEEEVKERISLLLREIHHRVKNNMQIISSMLNLQSGYVKDPQIIAMFEECQNRVKSMSLIHEKLYQSPDLSKIDFAIYIRSLVTELFKTYQIRSKPVGLKIHADHVYFDLDTAIPCGLIINELVSNSLKHAFPGTEASEAFDGREYQVRISLAPEASGTVSLTVTDNGIGLPAGFDIEESRTLGLRLVRALADQLGARIESHSSGGTSWKITIPYNRED